MAMKRPVSALMILAILLLVCPADAAVLWFMGAETGDLSEGTNIGGTPAQAVVASGAPGPVTGAYYMLTVAQTATSSGRGTPSGIGGTTIYARTHFHWQQAGNNNRVIVASGPGGQTIEVVLRASDKKLYWDHNNGSAIAAGSTVLSGSTWYFIEVQFVISASVGGVVVKLNGTTEITSLGTDTSDLTTFDIVGFGSTLTCSLNCDFGYDDMMVCSGNFCPHGGSIARQGTAGSPTYTAWTKNACTSSLIENCWSQTPFNATPNATDSVLNDAQTMLVHSFSTTQTGHGTETMLSVAAINACKTFMVAKAASGGTLSIRRRLNGVDTDTAKTVTTSDAGYDDGIWTDTVPHLNTSEIGVKQGANTVSQQVEDMWMICDYLAATGAPRHRVIQK